MREVVLYRSSHTAVLSSQNVISSFLILSTQLTGENSEHQQKTAGDDGGHRPPGPGVCQSDVGQHLQLLLLVSPSAAQLCAVVFLMEDGDQQLHLQSEVCDSVLRLQRSSGQVRLFRCVSVDQPGQLCR